MNSTPQIFKERLINGRLAHFTKENVTDFDKKFHEISLWHKSCTEKNLEKTKETSVQGLFMTRLFQGVFGYSEVVDEGDCYNQIRESKTVLDTTESDGALGFFYKSTGKKDVRVVIELKDAKTPLDKKQNRSSHAIRGIVNPAFKLAVSDDLIRKNPFDFQLTTVVVNDSQKREALTEEQMEAFLDFVKKDEHFKRYYEGMYILFHTGMRISEFVGLTMDDIDLDKGVIDINHQLQRKRNMEYVIEATKTTAEQDLYQ